MRAFLAMSDKSFVRNCRRHASVPFSLKMKDMGSSLSSVHLNRVIFN